MTAIESRDDDHLPPLPLNDATSIEPHEHLNELRASIESTIEQHLHDRAIAHVLSDAETVLHQRASSPFYAVNGAQYSSIIDFVAGVRKMLPHEYAHHANGERNDFSNWLSACFAEPASRLGTLAKELDREQFLAVLHRLEESAKPQQPAELPAPAQRIPFQPLPPAPLALPTPIEHVHDELRRIEQLMETDLPAARDAFIGLRTYIWQELTERDRKEVLPRLRATYIALVSPTKH